MSVSYNQLPSYCNHKECQYSVSKFFLTFPCTNKLVLWINSLPSASNSQKFFLITIFIIVEQNRIKNKIPYRKLTWTILHVKSHITFTSSILSTDSLTTAVLGSIAFNYLIKQIKIQKIFWWLDHLKKVYLSNQLRRNHCHICNLHHLCSFHDHCM